MTNINKENAKQLLLDLVKIPSYLGPSNLDAETGIANYLDNWITKNLPDLDLVKIPFDKKRQNLFYKSSINKILFACHMDTIPLQSGTIKPKVIGDRVYGLGTKDMKGGIVAMLSALKEIGKQSKKQPASIIFYGDEEYSQQGMKALVKHSDLFLKPKLIISPESRFNIGYGSRGVCVVKLTISGKAAHSARPHLGVDAIQLFYKVYQNLCQNLSKKTVLGKSVVTITELAGGLIVNGQLASQPNMIPDHASGTISIRLAQHEKSEKLVEIINETVAKDGGKVEEIKILNDYPAYLGTKKDLESIIKAINENQLTVNFADPALAGYNDAGLLANKLGIPVITFGPYGEGNHSSDEWVSIQSIVDTAKVFYSLLNNQ